MVIEKKNTYKKKIFFLLNAHERGQYLHNLYSSVPGLHPFPLASDSESAEARGSADSQINSIFRSKSALTATEFLSWLVSFTTQEELHPRSAEPINFVSHPPVSNDQMVSLLWRPYLRNYEWGCSLSTILMWFFLSQQFNS